MTSVLAASQRHDGTATAKASAGPSQDRVLEVRGRRDTLLASLSVPEGEGWCLEWNHSVEGFPVLDCYRNDQGQMVLERSHQPDFAAGLGHVPGRGRQVSDGHGGYWIEDIHEPVLGNRYLLRVGSLRVNHRLIHAGKTVSLSELAAGQRVSIELRPMPAP
ncbi:DUF1850 domain-containing protein [Onishia niordana]|uniref:DUF1850 domain-containing protein n=1 Tax=Onishia niordana TaxID=2508711 RepID=UPI003F6DE698